MSLPLALPDWVPWWVALAVLLPLILYALAFLAMPFSVLGLKSRLEAIESRLDEIQGEIRSLSLRLPEPVSGAGFDGFRRPSRPLAPRAGSATPPADDEPPVMPRPLAPAVQTSAPDETMIPPLPAPPLPSAIVPIPPASRDLAAPARRFIRPVTRPEAARPTADRGGAPSPRAADAPHGGRSEPRIDWPR